MVTEESFPRGRTLSRGFTDCASQTAESTQNVVVITALISSSLKGDYRGKGWGWELYSRSSGTLSNCSVGAVLATRQTCVGLIRSIQARASIRRMGFNSGTFHTVGEICFWVRSSVRQNVRSKIGSPGT